MQGTKRYIQNTKYSKEGKTKKESEEWKELCIVKMEKRKGNEEERYKKEEKWSSC